MTPTAKKVVTPAEFTKARSERAQATFALDPIVRITLKGKSLTLELNNWAIKGVLVDTGVNLMSKGFGVDSMTDPIVLGSILFWSLQTHQPELTQDEVDKMFTYRHYSYVLDRLKEAVNLFLPDMSDMEVDDATGRLEDHADPQ